MKAVGDGNRVVKNTERIFPDVILISCEFGSDVLGKTRTD
jgi:hypothetical protein